MLHFMKLHWVSWTNWFWSSAQTFAWSDPVRTQL
jgi:hypothetical protein